MDKVGLATVGLPITSPFVSTIAVAGVRQQVWAQTFERRVLTLASDEHATGNPLSYRIEFGNIGQHYYQWRYSAASIPTVTPTTAATAPSTATATPMNQNGSTTPIRSGIAPTSAGCPIIYPVKGVTQGGVPAYDSPGSATYAGTKPAICFISPADAEAAGYRAMRR